jgi:hypothetical protein
VGFEGFCRQFLRKEDPAKDIRSLAWMIHALRKMREVEGKDVETGPTALTRAVALNARTRLLR